MALRIGPETCHDLDAALSREWLVTNGLGGYASGTIAGANTRRYHGLLVASMNPPVQRMVLLAALEEWVLLGGHDPLPLSAQEYWDGTVYPDGFRRLAAVEIDGMVPVFRWGVEDRTIEKRIWMEHGVNRTVISYRLLAGAPLTITLRPLFAHRDYHQHRHGQGGFDMAETNDGWIIDAEGVRSYLQVRPSPVVRSRPDWYWRVLHRAERERGLDDEEDLFTPGVVEIELDQRAEVVVVIGTEPVPPGWSATASRQAAQERGAAAIDPLADNPLAAQLLVAAEQFRVARTPSPALPTRGREEIGRGRENQRTVIAGYHWFTDWGRDSMISLPGLATRPGSLWEARAVLDTTFRYVDQGLIPNRFPDSGQAPEYDTIDATLWLFQALAAYLRVSGDWRFIADRLAALEDIIDWHIRGTRHNIRVDDRDGLLAGGEEGYALTWMDARVEDWVVTPRRGKPIEINALWYNALRLTADWCERAARPAGRYREMAAQAFESAQLRFWFGDGRHCYDVVDGPEGDDPSLRPNQVIALSLVYPLIEGDRTRQVLATVSERLLTPYGLRTLNREDPRYEPTYGGDQRRRDAAYHMGMVWPWLLGHYLDAHRRIHGDVGAVRRLLEPFQSHLAEAGLGTISEIFEPEPPYRPVGCIAQA
ncbi:MAG TPA: amylo-alpha-1,6-glucosidase, partial [Candidatus Dormibacteraeota bacterium]|nr:amylo-alpha-1,6-glucosidase [Candidatus Dormibacteraeota bacterium]